MELAKTRPRPGASFSGVDWSWPAKRAAMCAPSRAPTSSPRSIRQAPVDGSLAATCRAVGIGVIGNDQIGIDFRRGFQGQVDGAGFLRIGEGHGREIRIRFRLRGHHRDVGESRLLKDGPHGGPPTPCIGVSTIFSCRSGNSRGRPARHGRCVVADDRPRAGPSSLPSARRIDSKAGP